MGMDRRRASRIASELARAFAAASEFQVARRRVKWAKALTFPYASCISPPFRQRSDFSLGQAARTAEPVPKTPIFNSRPSAWSSSRETHLSAEQARPQAPAWFPGSHGHCGRPQGHRDAARARPQEALRLTVRGEIASSMARAAKPQGEELLGRLTRSAEFQALRRGQKFEGKFGRMRAVARPAARLLLSRCASASSFRGSSATRRSATGSSGGFARACGGRGCQAGFELGKRGVAGQSMGADIGIFASRAVLTMDFDALAMELWSRRRRADAQARAAPHIGPGPMADRLVSRVSNGR